MILVLLKRLLQMLVLVVVQVMVCNRIHLMGYATPMLYVLFLVYFPLNSNRIGNMVWAFLLGLIIDAFSNTPGEATGALTLTAFVQWPLLQASAPKECLEDMVPSYKTMGRWNHIRYVFVLVLVHHTAFYVLESFSFFHFTELLITYGSSLLLTFVMILILETLRHGK
ncbi:MAG: rod shape-determining protein MreD [Bacteroidaceae bacterium]|nr:rod shape-determining protein MreD [Bacteroidaceae bacterium]